jgi:hypothetical protein
MSQHLDDEHDRREVIGILRFLDDQQTIDQFDPLAGPEDTAFDHPLVLEPAPASRLRVPGGAHR